MSKQETTRVALLSDTHGYLCPGVLETVSTCDIAVHAGDICGQAILEQLTGAVETLVAVRGNNDRPELWHAEEREMVMALPHSAELSLPGGLLAVEHGHEHGWATPSHEKLRAAHPDARMVVYGHTHKRVIDRTASPWVVNPGAAGNVRNNGGPSCLVLHAGLLDWEIESFRF